MKVLVTGGAGFIGSTICSALADAGHLPVVLDDFSTGRREFVADRIWYAGDIADPVLLGRVLGEHPDIAVTIHCAAAIVVPESVRDPLRYYDNNLAKTLALIGRLVAAGRHRILFSSSAAVYDPPADSRDLAVDEHTPLAPASPYGRTKAMVDAVLADAAAAGQVEAVSLRYFNPIGADPRLRTGLQLARPTHALGALIEAWERRVPFTVTGVDWPTRDGSGLRDYIHVWDLARAHVRAVERFSRLVAEAPYGVVNLGTGSGTTVYELVAAFERVVGEPIEVVAGPRRHGDTAGAYARSRHDPALLGWSAELGLEDGIADALRWREHWLRELRASA